jgi:hypothetical protein
MCVSTLTVIALPMVRFGFEHALSKRGRMSAHASTNGTLCRVELLLMCGYSTG